MTTTKESQFVRHRLAEAQTGMLELGNLIARILQPEQHPHLPAIEAAAAKVTRALDAAIWELQQATCDIEAHLDRI